MRLTPSQWRALLRWFVRDVPSALIAYETRLDRKRVLRALLTVRRAMMGCIPAHLRRADREPLDVPRDAGHLHAAPQEEAQPPKSRSVVLGFDAAAGQVWAEVVPGAQVETLGLVVRDPKDRRLPDLPGLHRYAAVAYRGHFHRLAESASGRPSVPFGQIEAFWAYLQRHIKARGGIRRERLGLYLAEYSWRYNHRTLSQTEQLRALLKLIRQHR